MENFATPYSVIFNDGDQEHDKGVIGIHSCLTFKRFQSMVGQKTGLAAAQLSTVFVCKRVVSGAEKKQKLPINENTNFAIIISQHNPSKERDCYFLVSLKRSKKERRAAKKRVESEAVEEAADSRQEGAKALVPSQLTNGADSRKDPDRPTDCVTGNSNDENEEPRRPRIAVESEGGKLQFQAVGSELIDEQAKPSSPGSDSAPQKSAWKNGSILQRLSSGEVKSGTDQLQQQAVIGPIRVQPLQSTVSLPSVAPGCDKVSGTISPTSVLDASHQNFAPPAMAPPCVMVGKPVMYSGPENGAFTLFGQDPRAVNLRTLLEEAVASNMHFKALKWCKFCAFCRERNMGVAPFHWCVDDQVVPGMRGPNPAGPIGARAMKYRVAAA